MNANLNPDPGENSGILKEMDYDSQTNRRPREESDSEENPDPKLARRHEAGRNLEEFQQPRTDHRTKCSKMDERVERIKNKITAYPDFPKPGILFRDIFSVLQTPPVFHDLMAVLEEKVKSICPDVDIIMGLDSRGFLFGAPLALSLNKPFVPVRKRGKLPGELKQISYTLEYGTDVFEAQASSIKPGQKVVIIDDLLATGGSMKAASELVKEMGGVVALCLVCIELVDLKGRDKLKDPCEAIVKY